MGIYKHTEKCWKLLEPIKKGIIKGHETYPRFFIFIYIFTLNNTIPKCLTNIPNNSMIGFFKCHFLFSCSLLISNKYQKKKFMLKEIWNNSYLKLIWSVSGFQSVWKIRKYIWGVWKLTLVTRCKQNPVFGNSTRASSIITNCHISDA